MCVQQVATTLYLRVVWRRTRALLSSKTPPLYCALQQYTTTVVTAHTVMAERGRALKGEGPEGEAGAVGNHAGGGAYSSTKQPRTPPRLVFLPFFLPRLVLLSFFSSSEAFYDRGSP